MIRQLRRWLPDRYLGVVADSSYAVMDLLGCVAGLLQPVTVVSCLRSDAALYDPAPERQAGTNGTPRLKGIRQPTLENRLSDPKTRWGTLTVAWYRGHGRNSMCFV
jgi:DDE superfamily endonuclease